jgi:hypothetical protein
MPSTFTVLTYLPWPRREFYGQEAVWKAARALPDVRFVAVGRGGPEPGAPPNIEYAGEVTAIEGQIDAACVLLRLPEHDGLSHIVIQALARGRYAIWNHPYPGVIHSPSAGDAIEALRHLRDLHRSGTLGLNDAGARYASIHHDPATIRCGILQALDDEKTAAATRPPDRGPGPRIAISGDDFFSARVASNCVKYGSGLSASVLLSRKPSETAVSVVDLMASDLWYTIGQPLQPRTFEVAALLARKPRVLHWLGDEVELLRRDHRLARRLRSRRFRHIAQNETVAHTLAEFGLQTYVIPLPVAVPVPAITPLPAVFTLLLYVPAQNANRDGRHQYDSLIRALSGEPVRYIIAGGARLDVPAGICVEYIDHWSDSAALYRRATAIAQFGERDSIPLVVVEALLHGRHVLCPNEFPFVRCVTDLGDLETHVRILLQAHVNGTLVPQYQAAKAMASLYSPQRCLSLLANLSA